MSTPNYANSSDAELVARAKAGERDAYGALAMRHAPKVCAMVRARIGDTVTAEDITQKAIVRGMVKLAQLADPNRFGQWLLQIAGRMTNDHWSQCRHFQELSTDTIVRADPSLDYTQKDEVRFVLAMQSQLPQDTSDVVTLVLANYTTKEISRILNISEELVRQRWHRGTVGLQNALVRDECERFWREASVEKCKNLLWKFQAVPALRALKADIESLIFEGEVVRIAHLRKFRDTHADTRHCFDEELVDEYDQVVRDAGEIAHTSQIEYYLASNVFDTGTSILFRGFAQGTIAKVRTLGLAKYLEAAPRLASCPGGSRVIPAIFVGQAALFQPIEAVTTNEILIGGIHACEQVANKTGKKILEKALRASNLAKFWRDTFGIYKASDDPQQASLHQGLSKQLQVLA